MLCNHCEKETNEKESGICVHCGYPLGKGEYAPPVGFAFDQGNGYYYKSEYGFDPYTGEPIVKVIWFDPLSGLYQVTYPQGEASITSQQDIPTQSPGNNVAPISIAAPVPTEPPISTAPPTVSKKKRNKTAIIAIVTVVVLAVGGLGFGVWKLGLFDNILNKSKDIAASESNPDMIEGEQFGAKTDAIDVEIPESPVPTMAADSYIEQESNVGKFLIYASDVIDFNLGSILQI